MCQTWERECAKHLSDRPFAQVHVRKEHLKNQTLLWFFCENPRYFTGEYQNGTLKWYSEFRIWQKRPLPFWGEDKTMCQRWTIDMDTRCRLNPADQILWGYVLHKRESKPLLSQILQWGSDVIDFVVDDKESIVSLVKRLNINGWILGIVSIDI